MSEIDKNLDLINPETQIPAFIEFETDPYFESYRKE